MDEALREALRAAIRAELAPVATDLRRFVDRRIAELSAEFDAHVQLSDMTEEKLSGELRRMHETVASLVAVPAAQSRSSGIELESVVVETEAATERILAAAEAIQAALAEAPLPPALAGRIAAEVNTIFEACAFQDLTGQRIRRAIQHLEEVDDVLTGLMPEGTPARERVTVAALRTTLPEGTAPSADLGQAAIDALIDG